MKTTAVGKIAARSIEALRPYIARGDRVALLDFPSHQNAGDSLIYLGERSYLRELGAKIAYIADAARFDPALLGRRAPEATILLHGGGNLGDRWPHMQAFREHVITAFPGRRIVQLPQSIHFTEKSNLVRARAVMAAHPDLVLMMREQRSYQFALEHFASPGTSITYCPDLALGFRPTGPVGRPSVDVYALLRQDAEAVSRELRLPEHLTVEYADWGLDGVDRVLWRLARLPGRLQRSVPASAKALYPLVERSYNWQANMNVTDAVRRLSRGRLVLTDRLHATVLAGLLGLPVVSLDNDYGKVSGVYRDYLHLLPNVRFMSDPKAVPTAVTEALAGIGA